LEKNNPPAVSVIIPNYNHAQFLRDRMESVLRQTFTDFELIILDDASTDSSREIINEYASKDPRISFYPSAANSGSPFIQWNKGVKLAKAGLIWIAESDDVASPNFLKEIIAKHTEYPNIALAYCQSNRMNEDGKITGSWKSFTDDLDASLFSKDFKKNGIDFIDQVLIKKNVIPNASAVVFKKSVYNEVEGADEKLKTNSDWLTWLKMLLNYDVAFVAKPLNNFRYHSQSVIAKVHTLNNEEYKEQYDLTMRNAFVAYCNAISFELPENIIKQNKKYQSFDYGNKGIYQFKEGQYFKGLVNLIRASIFPKPTFGYFRRLITNKDS